MPFYCRHLPVDYCAFRKRNRPNKLCATYSVLKMSLLNTSTKVSTNLSGSEKAQGLEMVFKS